MSLSTEEIERYRRHLLLHEVGGPGQQKLKAARVLVVGAGGLGAPMLQYLAAAGVGCIGIVDDDRVSLSNLQRQVIHSSQTIGQLKTNSAQEAIARLNPNVHVEIHSIHLDTANARKLIAKYDIIADGSDNFATRYLVSDCCFYERKPLITGALGGFDASLTTLRPFEKASNKQPNPTYRCLFPEAPPTGTLPNCSEAGILGPLAGLLGSMMALEIIREIVGFGQGLVGKLLLIDGLTMRFETIIYAQDPDNPLNGVNVQR
ncbi:molybdopterin biosynthesis protein [Methylocystaceae bacterium]|nr:molybdopterin biosynthesis protein [Methylocystaceae bacterium]